MHPFPDEPRGGAGAVVAPARLQGDPGDAEPASRASTVRPSGGSRPFPRRWLAVWMTVLCGWLSVPVVPLRAGAVTPALSTGFPTVGMEGRLEVTLEGPPLEARPVSERSRLILRIAATQPHGTATRYDLRYMGLEPGAYDLREYLLQPDGRSATNLAPLRVVVAGLLPKDHDGWLAAYQRRSVGRLGGYRLLMFGAGGLWCAGLLVWLWRRWRRRPQPAPPPEAPAPSWADRLRPLVAAAAAGRLSTDGQAQLERLLVAHWRERLDLQTMTAMEALEQLRKHPEAGPLLSELERWLHHPQGASTAEVERWLEPYRGKRP